MKKSLLFLVFVVLCMPFLKSQNRTNIQHVTSLKGDLVLEGKTLIYQLKDSTIQIIPYNYRKLFHKKSPDELAFLKWQMQEGVLEIPVQEYSVEMIDRIAIRHRAARGRNMVIGMAAGFAGTLIYLNSRNLHPEAFDDYPDWEAIIFPPIGIGIGAIVGLSIPTLGKRFRINGNRKKYEGQKAVLGKYAIIK